MQITYQVTNTSVPQPPQGLDAEVQGALGYPL